MCIARRSLSFRIKIGGENGCEAADKGDDVVVEYKTVSNVSFGILDIYNYGGM